MSEKKEIRMRNFLGDKPLWLWLLVYLILTGVIFGISNLVLYLLGIVPWIGILILVGVGLYWGIVQYSIFHNKSKNES